MAKEIGENTSYQEYLIKIENVKGAVEVGKEQAKNLGNAQIKIFANSDSISNGVTSASKMLSPQTGLNLAGLLEGIGATDAGAKAGELISNFLTKDKSE